METNSIDVLSFENPFEEIPSIDQLLFFAENYPPELPIDPNSLNDPGNLSGCGFDYLLGSEDPLSDPVIWAFCNGANDDDDVTGNFQAGNFEFPEESSNYGVNGNCDGLENSVSGDHWMFQSEVSVPESEYNCSSCQKLREITHTNGMNLKRLEIHGRLGTITHIVLEKYDSSFQRQESQIFDFHKESMQNVKRFLVQYIEACKEEGYDVMQDPLSTFYEALCVGLNEHENPDDFLQFSPENTGDFLKLEQEMLKQSEYGSNEVGFAKIPLSVQRVRTGKLKMKDLIEYFGLPIEDAARKINLCPTVLKKICRRNGMLRWPYRKIRSIKRKISEKTERLHGSDKEEKAQIIADIQRHEQELASIYEAFSR